MSIEQSHTLHLEAMECVDRAVRAKQRGDHSQFSQSLREALALEKQAATLIADQIELEPSRSVLHRSAATLAFQCGEWREAERLSATALAGFPPEEIANELRDLMEQIYAKLGRKGASSLA